jgi:hypothetical protein
MRAADEEIADNPAEKGRGIAKRRRCRRADEPRESLVDEVIGFLGRSDLGQDAPPDRCRMAAIDLLRAICRLRRRETWFPRPFIASGHVTPRPGQLPRSKE